ncbi:hypothetical protein M404DRAFT_1007693 [Pisolithus tinctorius Marx 270]|uniref:Uncharacterized protein n=1 Tax=Pisolithus tinctorius Marx 270 TaxID=870435 RepID=A0A0C3NIG0_PISTI|nr:hypothetical protein M404DRAFT_1007693 [Pisolithus tinctorius Marx 270]
MAHQRSPITITEPNTVSSSAYLSWRFSHSNQTVSEKHAHNSGKPNPLAAAGISVRTPCPLHLAL